MPNTADVAAHIKVDTQCSIEFKAMDAAGNGRVGLVAADFNPNFRIFIKSGEGPSTPTTVTLTDSAGANYELEERAFGVYTVNQIPATGGASFNNNTEGVIWAECTPDSGPDIIPIMHRVIDPTHANALANTLSGGDGTIRAHVYGIENALLTTAKFAADFLTSALIADDAFAAEHFATDAIGSDALALSALREIVEFGWTGYNIVINIAGGTLTVTREADSAVIAVIPVTFSARDPILTMNPT